MPSTASSFVIGMATALAIAGGFAGTFIEDVSKQRATDRALREPPKATALNAMRPLMTRNDGAILRGPINDSDPSTSGLARARCRELGSEGGGRIVPPVARRRTE